MTKPITIYFFFKMMTTTINLTLEEIKEIIKNTLSDFHELPECMEDTIVNNLLEASDETVITKIMNSRTRRDVYRLHKADLKLYCDYFEIDVPTSGQNGNATHKDYSQVVLDHLEEEEEIPKKRRIVVLDSPSQEEDVGSDEHLMWDKDPPYEEDSVSEEEEESSVSEEEEESSVYEEEEESVGLEIDLLDYRQSQANLNDLPEGFIFSDESLEYMVNFTPKNLSDLSNCPGFGKLKLNLLGDEVTRIINRHCQPAPREWFIV